jgi:hypothetical protein
VAAKMSATVSAKNLPQIVDTRFFILHASVTSQGATTESKQMELGYTQLNQRPVRLFPTQAELNAWQFRFGLVCSIIGGVSLGALYSIGIAMIG